MNRALIPLFIFTLSMTRVADAVKAQDRALPGATLEMSRGNSDKADQSEISKLIEVLMATGFDGTYPNGFAQAVGLNKSMSYKGAATHVGEETRGCDVIYEAESNADGAKRPVCIYFVRTKKGNHDVQERHFRVSLDGKLESVVTLRNKLNDQGKAIKEGRSKVEEDINSPEIRKIFKADMKFWLKDWLKKQPKSVSPAPEK